VAYVQGAYVWRLTSGGLCPGGLCSGLNLLWRFRSEGYVRGLMSWWLMSGGGASVQGGLVAGQLSPPSASVSSDLKAIYKAFIIIMIIYCYYYYPLLRLMTCSICSVHSELYQ